MVRGFVAAQARASRKKVSVMPHRMKTLNCAVIGLGVGKWHADQYHKYEWSCLAALCDADAQRLKDVAASYGIAEDRCYTDYRKLLADAKTLKLDLLSVALPNSLHAPVSKAALSAGLHVLCEKPMAMNVPQARSMIAAARKHRRRLGINFSYRFHPTSMALKRSIDAGAIGDVYFGRTVWHRRRGMPRFGGWFGIREFSGGGPIVDLGVHRLDLAMWLMGNPTPVTVSGSVYNHLATDIARKAGKTFDVEDLGCALIRFDNGVTLLLEASWAGHSGKQEDMITHLYGTKGGAVQRNTGEKYDFEALLYGEHEGDLWESRLMLATAESPSPMTDMVDAILDGREPIATGDHGLAVQQILDAIYRSAKLGREVRISSR